MKGFVVKFNGKEVKVGVEGGGLIQVQFHCSNMNGVERNYIYVSGVDYEIKERSIWMKYDAMNLNDDCKIIYTNVDEATLPCEREVDTNIRIPSSKFEKYLQLENYLKEKGLI